VSERSSRRRLRLRRKRKGETFASKLLDVGNVADVADVVDAANSFGPLDAADAVEVVGHMGCCVVEAVGTLAVVLALLMVPAFLLLR
jgi:hypothetical protein